jgi:hypothetical protein
VALSRSVKALLGSLAVVFFVWFFVWAALLGSRLNDPKVIGWALYSRLPALTIAFLLALFGQVAFYIAWMWRTDRVVGWKRAVWTVVLIMFHAAAMPVFFFLYVSPVERNPSLAL